MSPAINRMQFLRGDLKGKKSPIRPPWSGDENKFIDTCTSCGDCVKQCPSKIIQKGRGNYPIINFNMGECFFCNKCVDICKPGALKINQSQQPWSVIANMNTESCLAFKGVECRSCFDPCEAGAIKITPHLGGVSIPAINASLCTGCGACFAICPSKSINMNINQ